MTIARDDETPLSAFAIAQEVRMTKRFVGWAAQAVATALLLVIAAPAPAQKVPARRDTSAVRDTTTARAKAPAADSDTVFESAGMQEFEARRKQGGGYYLTRDQMRRNRDRSLGEILIAHFPGVRVVYGAHLNSQYLVSTRGEGSGALVSNTGGSLCYVQVFYDGSFVIDGDISWIDPNDIAGVELYDATRTPPAYRRPDGQCGALLVWPRTGG